MSEVLRRAMLLILCILTLTVEAAAQGGDTRDSPTRERRLAEAARLGEQIKKLQDENKDAEAVPLAEQALQIRESVLGRNHLDVAQSLIDLALLYRDQRAYAKAEPLFLRALQIKESTLGKNHLAVADTLNDIAILYWLEYDPFKAEPFCIRALQIRESTLGSNHRDVAVSLEGLGILYVFADELPKAEPLFLRALEIKESLLGKNHPGVAQTLDNLADLYNVEGIFKKAEPLYLRALQIQESALGKNHERVAMSLLSLAKQYREQGAYQKAEPMFLRALQIFESYPGKDDPFIAATLGSLSGLYRMEGDYQKAESLGLRALQLGEASLGKDHPAVSGAVAGLALLYRDQGDYQKAEKYYLRILQGMDTRFPGGRGTMSVLGDLYKDEGDYKKSESFYLHALEVEESAKNSSPLGVADLLSKIANLYQAQGGDRRTTALRKRALLTSEQNLRLVRLALPESRLDWFLKRLQPEADTNYTLSPALQHDPDAIRLALATGLLRKGRSLEETALASQEYAEFQTRFAGSKTNADFVQLQSLRHRIARLLIQDPVERLPGQPEESLQSLEDRFEQLEQKLVRQSSMMRKAREAPSPEEIVTRVSRALPNDGVLVEVVGYRPYLFKATGKMPRWDESRYQVLVLSPDDAVEAIDLGLSKPTDQAILTLLERISDQGSSPAAYLSAAQAVYQKIFAPLLPALHGRKQIFLSLDGHLQQVPFAALHDGASFLLDNYHFNYLSSGRDLLRPAATPNSSRSMVVMANPDFANRQGSGKTLASIATAPQVALAVTRGVRQASISEMIKGLEELPGTQVEADLLKRRFPWAKVLVRQAATKSALLG